MKEIIEWLIRIEDLAGEFYSKSAIYFETDETMFRFLKMAFEDEVWHYNVLNSAKLKLDQQKMPVAAISISEEIYLRIENSFHLNLKRLMEKTLTKEQVLDCIAETEFSEWNKIFLYVVESLKNEICEFSIVAAKIQGHLGRTQNFLELFPYGVKKLKELTNLEKVFTENILVVEDDDVLSHLMSSLLEEIGNVDSAQNGQHALEKLKEKYYKLIVSDISMPEMDGIEFYNTAVSEYKGLHNRFLFSSGFIDKENEMFFKENNITFLPKPCDIEVVLHHASRILNQP